MSSIQQTVAHVVTVVAFHMQVDRDLQAFRREAHLLGQREAGTPDADDGVVERYGASRRLACCMGTSLTLANWTCRMAVDTLQKLSLQHLS